MPEDIVTCNTCSALVANAAAHARWHEALEERLTGHPNATQKQQEKLEQLQERRAAQATIGSAQKQEDFASDVLRRLRG